MPTPTYKLVKEAGGLRKPLRAIDTKITQKVQDHKAAKAEAAEAKAIRPPLREPALSAFDLPSMTPTTEFTSRELDQPIDTIAIIPKHPDYIVVGTYHLDETAKDDDEEDDHTVLRFGSLQILPYDTNPTTPDVPTELDRKDFNCAIVDIHFHETYKDLVGAATSTGEVRFFNILREYSNDLSCSSFHIIELGIFSLYNQSISSSPLVTQFVWLPWSETAIILEETPTYQATLALCDSLGNSHILELSSLRDIRSLYDPRLQEHNTEGPPHMRIEGQGLFFPIHQQTHGLEAWSIATFRVSDGTNYTTPTTIILSGGDDNTLIASQSQLVFRGWTEPSRLFTDKKTHNAGIVSILPLSNHAAFSKDLNVTPILTGSYDEHIRLFLFDKRSMTSSLVTAFQIDGGGVWKLVFLDSYVVKKRLHYVLLVCAMQEGARIVRLSVPTDPYEFDYVWGVEAVFKQGHTSMVYAAVAKEVGSGKWCVVTTSFYDKMVCGWEWVDRVKRK